jgi:hypothetical protein
MLRRLQAAPPPRSPSLPTAPLPLSSPPFFLCSLPPSPPPPLLFLLSLFSLLPLLSASSSLSFLLLLPCYSLPAPSRYLLIALLLLLLTWFGKTQPDPFQEAEVLRWRRGPCCGDSVELSSCWLGEEGKGG